MKPEHVAPRIAARLTSGDREKAMPGPDDDCTPTEECAALLRRLGCPSLARRALDTGGPMRSS